MEIIKLIMTGILLFIATNVVAVIVMSAIILFVSTIENLTGNDIKE